MADFEAVDPWDPELDATPDQEPETVGTGHGDVLETEPEVEEQGPEGLLFTGDVIRTLTLDQLAVLGDFASRMFGVEMQPIQNVARELGQQAVSGSELEEEEPAPVLVTRKDVLQWAVEHGYGKDSTNGAYSRVYRTLQEQEYGNISSAFPSIRWTGSFASNKEEIRIDLRSVYERLAGSGLAEEAWERGTADDVSLLVHIVNDLVQLDEPLPTSRDEWVRRTSDH